MKKILYLFITLLLPLLARGAAIGVHFTDGPYANTYYNLYPDTKTAKIAKNPDGYSGDVVFAPTLTYNGETYTVTSTEWRCCYDNKGLTSVALPNTLTSIYQESFRNCTGLTSFVFPEGLKTIDSNALWGCTNITSATFLCNLESDVVNLFSNLNVKEITFDCENVRQVVHSSPAKKLEKVTFTNKVKTIAAKAFPEANQLTSITIPSSVTKIGSNAFYKCSALKEVHITDLAAWCGIEFENAFASPVVYAEHIFLNGKEITELQIPEGVTTIPIAAFANCISITSVSLPKSVLSISESAFDGCESLTEVSMTEGIQTIGPSAFADCSILPSITLPNTITTVGESAFSSCTKLASIKLSESTESIGASAFFKCSSLSTISIPASVKSIGNNAFSDCKGLKAVNTPDIAAWCGIDFLGDTSIPGYSNPIHLAHCLYLNGELITDLKIPEGVTAIKQMTFMYCYSIESITFPSSLESIGTKAFDDCDNIKEVICFANQPPTVTDRSFYNVNTNEVTLWVHESAVEAYKAAYIWKGFGFGQINSVLDDSPLKCAKPTISYEDGKFVFKSETPGVTFYSEVTEDEPPVKGSSNIRINPTFTVKAYCTRKACEDSEVTTVRYSWADKTPQIIKVQ